MGTIKISRREACEEIKKTFDIFSREFCKIRDDGEGCSKDKEDFLDYGQQFMEGVGEDEFWETLSGLTSQDFRSFYDDAGKFARAYEIANKGFYDKHTPVLLEDLCVELAGHKKTADKLDFIDSFQNDELRSNLFTYDSKIRVITDILDDKTVFDRKEQGINKVIGSFSGEESSLFMARLNEDSSFLDALMDKINGKEKNALLSYFLNFLSGQSVSDEEYRIPHKVGFDASYKNGKVRIKTYRYIDRKISRYKYKYLDDRELSPFTNVTMFYGDDENEITVPAIVLVKSRGDVVLYEDFYKSNIDWKSLDDAKKLALYKEFVLHYLPEEFGEALIGDPAAFLVMAVVGLVIGFAGGWVALCFAALGGLFSAKNIIDGIKLVEEAVNSYKEISDIKGAKESARTFARGLAKLGVEVIPVLFGLLKRGFAKYNGKEIKVGGKTGNTPVKENAGVNSGTQRSRTVKDILTDAGYKDEKIINNPEYGEKIEQLRLLYSDEDIISNIKNMKTTGKKSIGFILDNMKSKMSAKGGQTSFKNYDTSKGTPHQNGNWAEHLSFEDYINNPKLKEAGYDLKRVGLAAPDSPNETLRKGIDGIYKNVSPDKVRDR